MKRLIETVHFTVDPDGITRLIRDMWREGSYAKALEVLSSMACGVTIPQEIQYDILRGKKKFANYRGNPDQFIIVRDNWKPSDPDYYPDPEPSKMAAYLKKRADEKTEREIAQARRGMIYEAEDEQEFDNRRIAAVPLAWNPPSKKTQFPAHTMKQFGGFDSLDEMNMAMLFKRSVPTPEELIQTMHDRDEREAKGKPKPDKTLLADAGWIIPNGNFYACLTPMEHIWLAGQFGLTERQAEESGWVKISRDFTGQRFVHKGRIDPNQKQINTVFDWCEKHKFKLPDWAGGDDE